MGNRSNTASEQHPSNAREASATAPCAAKRQPSARAAKRWRGIADGTLRCALAVMLAVTLCPIPSSGFVSAWADDAPDASAQQETSATLSNDQLPAAGSQSDEAPDEGPPQTPGEPGDQAQSESPSTTETARGGGALNDGSADANALNPNDAEATQGKTDSETNQAPSNPESANGKEESETNEGREDAAPYADWRAAAEAVDAGKLTGDAFKPEGSGTEAAPYSIATPEAFAWWALLHPDAHATLASDIDLTARTNADGEPLPWPGDTTLAATLDGASHNLSFITEGAGLFAEIAESGTAEWLFLGEPLDAAKRPSKVASAETLAGALAGTNRGTVQGVVNRLPVSVAEAADGALATAREAFAGGIVAVNDGIVRDCANLGDVENPSAQGNSAAAGIAAQGIGRIETSYNVGNVRAAQNGAYLTTLLTADGAYDDIVDDASCYLAPDEATYEGIAQAGIDRKGALSSDELKAAADRLNAGREADAAVWSAGSAATNGYPVPAKPADTAAGSNALAAPLADAAYSTWYDVGEAMYDATKEHPSGVFATPDGREVAAPKVVTVTDPMDGSTTTTVYAENAEQLAMIMYSVNNKVSEQIVQADIVLSNDINLQGAPYTGDTAGAIDKALPWVPMGTSTNPFTGTFDGDHNTVSNMYLPSAADGAGLFGTINSTGSYAAASIENVNVNGSISCSSGAVGSVVGSMTGEYGTVSGCTSSVDLDVSNASYAGGIVGSTSSNAKLARCLYAGAITNSSDGTVGGIVGYANNTGLSLSDCASIARIVNNGSKTGSKIGGLAGYAVTVSSFQNCYVGGVVEGNLPSDDPTESGAMIGAVVGFLTGMGFNAGSCYYNSDTSLNPIGRNDAASSGYTAMTPAQMKDASFVSTLNGSRSDSDETSGNYAPWSADTKNANGGFPILAFTNPTYGSWEAVGKAVDEGKLTAPSAGTSVKPTNIADAGSGDSAENPYLIDSPEALAWFAYMVNIAGGAEAKHVKLTADINLTGDAYGGIASSPLAWVPIKNIKSTFDGGGHTVSHMWASDLSGDGGDVGFINIVLGGVVKGINLTDSTVEAVGDNIAVGLVVALGDGSIERCSVSSSVKVKGAFYAAGLVGQATSSSVTDCWSRASVSSDNDAGGIVAHGLSVKFSGCYAAPSALDSTAGATGAILASNVEGCSYERCYYDQALPGANVIGEAKTTAELTDLRGATVAGLLNGPDRTGENAVWRADFGAINDGYPSLRGPGERAVTSWLDVGALADSRVLVQADGTSYPLSVESGVYSVGSPESLAKIWQTLLFSYSHINIKLTADIDLMGAMYTNNSGEPLAWMTLPQRTSGAYTGTFDGAGHTISNMRAVGNSNVGAYTDTDSYAGFFTTLGDGATVQDVNFVSSTASAKTYAGIVVGALGGMSSASAKGGTTVQRCSVGSDCEVSSSAVAGIAGSVFAGATNPNVIQDCFNRATVRGTGNIAAGIAGQVCRQTPYATSGTSTVKVQIKNCYNTGDMIASETKAYEAGLVGLHQNVPLELENSVYLDTTSQGIKSVTPTMLTINTSESWTAASMQENAGATLAALLNAGRTAKNAVWRGDWRGENDNYPMLYGDGDPIIVARNGWELVGKAVEKGQLEGKPSNADAANVGSDANPYLIDSPEALAWFAYMTNDDQAASYQGKAVKLTQDIDLVGAKYGGTESDPLQWNPICVSGQYEATFDGDGHTISHMSLFNEPYHGGLIGSLKGTVKGVNLAASNLIGVGFVGGLAGASFGNADAIVECSVGSDVTVHSLTGAAGGFVGAGDSSSVLTFRDCWSRASVVSGYGKSGGFIGSPYQVTMTNCYAAPTALLDSASESVGGALCGEVVQRSSTFENCYYNSDGPGTVNYGTPKTEKQLTALGMEQLLNAGRADGPWAADFDMGKNDGYPVIGRTYGFTNWQQVGAAVTSAQLMLWPTYDSAGAETGFALEGSGTQASPYVVNTPEALAWYANQAITDSVAYGALYVKLGADIDLSGMTYTGVAAADLGNTSAKALNWVSFPRTGTVFDGGGHRVKYCNDSVFSSVDNATVQDLATDVTCSRTTTGSASIVTKAAKQATFERCANYANLTTSGGNFVYVGGFVQLDGNGSGQKNYLTFTDCLNAGNIALTTSGGTDRNVGGFVGYGYSTGSYFYNCYNIGTIGGGNHRGAFTAHGNAIAQSNNYYLQGTGGETKFGTSLTAAQMKTWGMAAALNGKAAGAGTVWTQTGSDYPTPTGLAGTPLPAADWQRVGQAVANDEGPYGSYKPALASGTMDGTADHPLEIGGPESLAYYMYMVNTSGSSAVVSGSSATWKTSFVTLTENIDLAAKYNGVNADGTAAADTVWTAIAEVNGSFDGAGHEISGFAFDTSRDEANAPISVVDYDGMVKNLSTGGFIDYQQDNGQIMSAGVACVVNGTVQDCTSRMNYTKKWLPYFGGIACRIEGVVQRCSYEDAVVTIRDNSYIVNNTSGRVGGIVGYMRSGSVVRDCYTRDSILGTHNAITAGIVAEAESDTTIKNCYSKARFYNFPETNNYAISPAASTDCYWQYWTDARPLASEGVTEQTAAQMMSPLMALNLNNGRTGTDPAAGADVYAPWTWNALVNNGYPSFGTPPATKLSTWEDVAKLQQEDALRRTKVTFTDGYGSAGDVQAAEPSGNNYTAALSGLGTSASPYVVSTPEALAWAAWRVNQNTGSTELYVELGAGIDLAGLNHTGKTADDVSDSYTNCLRWMPMGTSRTSEASSSTFTGGFDGKNFPIKNLYVNGPSYYAGLFGYAGSNAVSTTVKRVVLKSGSSITSSYASALIGRTFGGMLVQDCRNEGVSVTATTGSIAAGFVSSCDVASALVVERCSNHAPVQAPTDASGIVGSYARGGTVRDCYNAGVITATASGGIVAGVYGYVGDSIKLANCYNVGALSAPSTGAAYGVGSTSATMSNCWYDSTTTGAVTARAGAVGVTTAQLQTWGAAYQLNGGTTLSGVSDAATWRMASGTSENGGYPVLLATGSSERLRAASTWLEVGAWVDTFATSLKPGAASGATGTLGTSGNPYQISKPEQLAWLAYISRDGQVHAGDQCATVTTDIPMGGTAYTGLTESDVNVDTKKALQWRGIGLRTAGNNDNLYRSTFDGGNKVISLLNESSVDENMGLFMGVGSGAVVKNVGVASSYFKASHADRGAGAIAGIGADQASIQNCSTGSLVSVEGSGANNQGIGGILGTSTNSSSGFIKGCKNFAKVTDSNADGAYAVGGIVGFLPDGYVVEDCENHGNVTVVGALDGVKFQCAGGIVGRMMKETSSVSRCFSADSVTVSAPGHTGGIVGECIGAVKDCYSRAQVPEGNRAGGIAGWMSGASAKIENCYAVGKVRSGGGMLTGGLVGGSIVNSYGMSQVGSASVLDGFSPDATYSSSRMASADQMASAGFAFVLNAGRAKNDASDPAPWAQAAATNDKPAVNDGFPYLSIADAQAQLSTWQQVGQWQDATVLKNTAVAGTTLKALSGSGTSGDPYVASTPEALAWAAYQVNKNVGATTEQYVQLGADIDLSGLTYTGKAADGVDANYANCLMWVPFGNGGSTVSTAFSGMFDGANHAVKNLYISTDQYYYALIGKTKERGDRSRTEVKNVSIESGRVATSMWYAAAVVGYADSTIVSDCTVGKDMTVSAGLGIAAGIAAIASGSQVAVARCSSAASVSAPQSVAGIFAYGANATIAIDNCYNMGAVKASGIDAAKPGAAGICPEDSTNFTANVKNCYNVGAISAANGKAYAVGATRSVMTNCWYDADTTGSVTAQAGAKGVTTTQLKSWGGAYQLNDPRNADHSYKPVASNNVWKKDADKVNGGYPVLIAQGSGERVQDPYNWGEVGSWVDAFATDLKPGGSGTSSEPYKIGTAEALGWFSNLVRSMPASSAAGTEDAVLTANIDLLGTQFTGKTSAGAECADSVRWSSIGVTENNIYKGTFDGDGHAVKNMRTGSIGNSSTSTGFVSYAQNSTFKDLAVDGYVDVYVSNAGTIGQAGLMGGELEGCSISGCSTSGEVYANGQSNGVAYAGGIVGGLEGGSMTGCSSAATVTSTNTNNSSADNAAGGLVGRAISDGAAISIERCSGAATVKDMAPNGAAGGVLGVAQGTGGVAMKDCSAAGTVSAKFYVGGIVGSAEKAFTLSNAYSRAAVTGGASGALLGGLLGSDAGASSGNFIERGFWLKGASSLKADGAGSIDTRDVAELSADELKGRVDMAAADAPTAGLGGTNVVDVLNTTDKGERRGSDAVWIVAPDTRNNGYPDFETASVTATGTATVDPSTGKAATSGSSNVGASSVILEKMNLLRPPRLYDGNDTASNPLKTPTWELVSGSDVADNYALWAGGSDAQASADKKLGLFVTTTQTGGAESDLFGHDGATDPSMGAMGGFRVRAAAAYSETKPRTAEFLLTDNSGAVRRQTVTISGATARDLDVVVPVEASLGGITPDAKLHAGSGAAAAVADSAVQNKTEAPVQGSVTSVSALAVGTQTQRQLDNNGQPRKVNTVLPTMNGTATLTANNRSIVDATNPNAKLGVKAASTSGLTTLEKSLYASAIKNGASGSLPLSMTLAGGTAADPRKVGFRWFLDYTGTWIGDDAVYGYTASYSFAPATKDVPAGTPASIGEATS